MYLLTRRLILRATILIFCSVGSTLGIAQTAVQSPKPTTFAGVSTVKVFDYEGCVELKNETTRVVLGHHRGGRILKYELNGRNALYLADESSWDPDSSGTNRRLFAGRFDMGPEQLQARGDALWQGPWTVEATGDRQATMTSVVDPDSGMQVSRTINLAEDSSRLTVTQTVFNRGSETVRQCYWSRTFANHGGIAVVPCDSFKSRLPNLYYLGLSGKLLNIRPEEQAVRREGDFLIIDGPPSTAKMGFDSVRGWVAYQSKDDLLFVKRFEVAENRNYGEAAGINLSIWYPKKDFLPCCEIEPIGPMQNLKPGEQASYSVDWWLLESTFPPEGKVDPVAIEKRVQEQCQK